MIELVFEIVCITQRNVFHQIYDVVKKTRINTIFFFFFILKK